MATSIYRVFPRLSKSLAKGLVKMNATLLEKVEELTLYSIQLEKADQQKQQKLQSLEQKQVELEQLLKQVLKRK